MKKTALIVSVLITFFLLGLIKNGEFTGNEAAIMLAGKSQSREIIPRNPIIQEDIFEGFIFFDTLKISTNENFDYDNFLILTDNKDNSGKYKFAFKEIIDGFSHENSGRSEFAFFNNSVDLKLRALISEKVLNPNIISVSFKDGISDVEYLEFVGKLKPFLNGKTLIITEATLSGISDPRVKAFKDDYTKHVLALADEQSLSRLEYFGNGLKAFLLFSKFFKINAEKFYDSDLGIYYKEGEVKNERAIFIHAFGDMMLGRYVRTLMDIHGHDYIFENIKDENSRFFKGSDIVFANLEGPIKGNGFKSSTSMIFGFPDYVSPLLKKYKFDLLSLANNHTLNQGRDGIGTTISSLEENQISWCGHPSRVSMEDVKFAKIMDKKYAFICFNDVEQRINQEEAKTLVKEVAPLVDFLIVSAHFGVEYKHRASEKLQVEPFRAWIDNGADFIIGHHPHVVQNFEVYKGKFIFYSLGNFIFDQYWSSATQEGLSIGIRISDNNAKVYLFPIKSEKSKPRLMNSKEYEEWIERFIRYGDYSEELKNQIRKGFIEISE